MLLVAPSPFMACDCNTNCLARQPEKPRRRSGIPDGIWYMRRLATAGLVLALPIPPAECRRLCYNGTSASQHTLRAEMEYKKFQQLVKGGEKDNVDFKIRCDAFNSKLKQPKAELAKDICTMANNGHVASYIIVGVSDDGKGFESVSNTNLTEEKLQSFCKAAISPPPRVRVHTECWPKAAKKHKGKRFVIIQVGPNTRQAFRLARDFITWNEGICYRRNEVWIRRGSTSDLAAPEEIVRLAKGQAPTKRARPERKLEYLKMPSDLQDTAILTDLRTWAEEVGGRLHKRKLVVPIGGAKHVWQVVTSSERTARSPVMIHVANSWEYEHGFLFLVLGTVYKSSLPSWATVQFKARWGWFTELQSTFDLPHLPRNKTDFSVALLSVPHISDTHALRDRLSALLEFLNTDTPTAFRVQRARDAVNDNLRRWRREGWDMSWDRTRPARPSELKKLADTILELSADRQP